MAKTLRTLVFRVHNPSHTTRALLVRTLRAYTLAASAVLAAAQRDWEEVRAESLFRERLTTLSLAAVLTRRYRPRIRRYPLHSSLREALFADLAGDIGSYDALRLRWQRAHARKAQAFADRLVGVPPHLVPWLTLAYLARLRDELGNPPAWPSVPRTVPDEAGYQAALDALVSEEAPRLDRPLADYLHTGTRPLGFLHPDGAAQTRGFALVRSAKDGRYYALLYLLPGDDGKRRNLAVPPPAGRRGALVAVHPAATVVRPSRRPSCAVLLPLACGAWHEETALREAVLHPESVRVAKLVHRPAHRNTGGTLVEEAFDLAITFEQAAPDPRQPRTILVASMAEDATITWCVVDPAHETVAASGTDDLLCGIRERWRAERRHAAREGRIPPRAHHIQQTQVRHATHLLANRLIAVADAHDAQVVVQDMRYLRARKVRPPLTEDGTRAARRAAWHAAAAETHYRRSALAVGQLHDALASKLPRVGLPAPRWQGGVSPRDCPACGNRSAEPERCTHCGAVLDGATQARATAHRYLADQAQRPSRKA